MSELVLAMSCHEQPWALQQWFPQHHLKEPLPKSVAENPDEVERRLAATRCYAGGVLRSYQEPVLAQGAATETYRLIWSPSFESTVVIRVEESRGRYVAIVKRDVSKASELSGKFMTTVREVSASDFAGIRAAAANAGCWAPSHTCRAESSIERLPGGEAAWVVVDGDSWLLEGARGSEHWGVTVHSPAGSPFLVTCEAIVRAARAEGEVRLRSRSTSESLEALTGDGGVE